MTKREEHLQKQLNMLLSDLVWTRIDPVLNALEAADQSYIKASKEAETFSKEIQKALEQAYEDKMKAREVYEDFYSAKLSMEAAMLEAVYIKGFTDCLNSKGTIPGFLELLKIKVGEVA